MDVLTVKNLSVSFFRPEGEIEALKNVSFSLREGEILAVMGETGCGKSVLCKSILKLLPDIAQIKTGHIDIRGEEITGYSEKQMRKLRGHFFSMVFQNPMTALNPCMSVGEQIAEAVRLRQPCLTGRERRRRTAELMELVGLNPPGERAKQYPFQLSGGMAQRCVIAIALAAEPTVLFADEATTALDVTVQAQILELFLELRKRMGMSIVLVTHNPGVAARIADRVALMRDGALFRIGDVEEILEEIIHNRNLT
ncbi:MAG: ABC transporter ATP-binding protein [Lachnospiraceae bacterium]|nr:ABC transporter ATP-binding protein [Lachnospiraceae bacterium]